MNELVVETQMVYLILLAERFGSQSHSFEVTISFTVPAHPPGGL